MARPFNQEANRPVFRAGWRFLVTGGLSYLVDVATLVALHDGLGWPVGAATTGAYLTSFAVNFSLNRSWVFGASTGSAAGQLWRYLLLVGVNYLLTLGLMLGLTELGLNIVVAKTIVTALIAIMNFVVYRAWVFRPAPAVDSEPDRPAG